MAYIESSDFNKAIDYGYWRYVTKESIVKDVGRYRHLTKRDFLNEIARKINSGNYRPQACRVVGFPKSNGVIRPVMHFELEDTLVYYYCLRILQDKLVARISQTEHIYGGFKLTTQLALTEESVENLIYDPQYESFTKFGFRKAWSDYQNLARQLSEGDFSFFMHLDVAHFYDAIPLNKLELEIRHIASGMKDAVDLLFFLLKNIKTKHNFSYSENIVGLPQEEVGEMSRLLANFYLASFDEKVVVELERLFAMPRGTTWQYTRWADDMWFAFEGRRSDALRISQIVSQLLSDLSLHLNESKTRIYSKPEYVDYWGFSDWDRLLLVRNKPDELVAFLKLISADPKKETRWPSLLTYGLKVLESMGQRRPEVLSSSSEFLVEIILQNVSLFGRTNQSIISILKAVLSSSADLRTRVLKSLAENESMYPLVSFVLWEAMMSFGYRADVFEALSTSFYASRWRDLWWYERCIFLRYFASKDIQKRDPVATAELLAHIESVASEVDGYERRYMMFVLLQIGTAETDRLLKRDFVEASDRKFLDYYSARRGSAK